MKSAGDDEKRTGEPQRGRNGKLKIDMPFEDAISAALEVKPVPIKPTKKKRVRKVE